MNASRKNIAASLLIVIYWLGFFVSFGNVYILEKAKVGREAVITAGLAAVFWPVYFPLRFSVDAWEAYYRKQT